MSPPNRSPSTATPSTATDRPRTDSRLSRRTFIAAGSTTALVSMAGCSAVVDFLADLALQEVNVFNGADESVSGSIEIVDPDGETVLEETFDLEEEPEEDEETSEDNQALAQYDDVWTGNGEYKVTVALDDPLEGSESADEETDENAQNESSDSDPDVQNESVDPDSDAADGPANDSSDADPAPDEDADDEPSNDSDSDDDPTDEESQNGPSKTDTVTVDDTDEQKLVIGIDQEEPDELLSYHVIEDFSDLEDEFEE